VFGKMDKIRIRQEKIKKIEVNDKGEYIELNFNDRSFPHRFFELIKSFESKEKEFMDRAKKIEILEEKDEKTKASLELDKEIHYFLLKEVDKVFGNDTCKKVFGDIIPSAECYKEFFEALMPYFQEFAKETAIENKKYTAERKGSV
jgi:hypothetical protein